MANIKTDFVGHTLELKNVRETEGHDDSIPFVADVYFDDEHIGNATNDGWGADCFIRILPEVSENTKEQFNAFEEQLIEIHSQGHFRYTVNFLVDYMAYQCIDLHKSEFEWEQE